MCMVRMTTRGQACLEWKDEEPCPNAKKRLQTVRKNARFCKAYMSSPGEYEVSEGKSNLLVSLNNKTCACGLWKISGMPCKHVMRTIIAAEEDPYKYTSNWFSVVVYKKTYSHNIKAIPDQEQWPEMDMPFILPPAMKRGVGRPSRNRRKEEGEQEKGRGQRQLFVVVVSNLGTTKRLVKVD